DVLPYVELQVRGTVLSGSCGALTSERTAYVEKQVRCTVLSPGDNQGNESDAPSSLQTPECSVPAMLPAEPGQDTAWTVASNAAKAQPQRHRVLLPVMLPAKPGQDATPSHPTAALQMKASDATVAVRGGPATDAAIAETMPLPLPLLVR
ncbi:hypothetical protein PC129_g24916, partial [Phytophthora cactorum]